MNKQSKGSTNELPIFDTQLHWFLEKRVELVRAMLDEKRTGLPIEKCVDLLLEQCDNALKEPPPSKKIIKKLVPPFAFIGLVMTTLLSAYLYADSPFSEIQVFAKPGEWLNVIMSDLAPELISDPRLLDLFLMLCVCLVVIYLVIAFIGVPLIVFRFDRTRHLTEELRSVLQYIKKCQIE